jgi:hypothetical protein
VRIAPDHAETQRVGPDWLGSARLACSFRAFVGLTVCAPHATEAIYDGVRAGVVIVGTTRCLVGQGLVSSCAADRRDTTRTTKTWRARRGNRRPRGGSARLAPPQQCFPSHHSRLQRSRAAGCGAQKGDGQVTRGGVTFLSVRLSAGEVCGRVPCVLPDRLSRVAEPRVILREPREITPFLTTELQPLHDPSSRRCCNQVAQLREAPVESEEGVRCVPAFRVEDLRTRLLDSCAGSELLDVPVDGGERHPCVRSEFAPERLAMRVPQFTGGEMVRTRDLRRDRVAVASTKCLQSGGVSVADVTWPSPFSTPQTAATLGVLGRMCGGAARCRQR